MVTRSQAPVVTKKLLQGDLKPEPQNQLELKVNASIQWTTTVNASIEFKRYVYSFSMLIDSFPFSCFENGTIITQRQNSLKNRWEKQQKLANLGKKNYFKKQTNTFKTLWSRHLWSHVPLLVMK